MRHVSHKKGDKESRSVAYFSMEIGVDPNIPTYSGGLGVLAGDTVKTFADLLIPAVAITLVSRKGYFKQSIENGEQRESPQEWDPADRLKLHSHKVKVKLEGRDVQVQAWEFKLKGAKGFDLPLLFLDTDIPGNSDEDRHLTDYLYGGDQTYRLKQETILGVGGVRILHALGYDAIEKYHMNEGHAALLTLELLKRTEKKNESDPFKKYDVPSVVEKCVFTTHTPVPAGHDKFPVELFQKVVGDILDPEFMKDFFIDGKLNMTILALSHAQYVNGVAKKHGEVSKQMFPGFAIDSITNGVHSKTWTSPIFKKLYNKHIPGWQNDPYNLRYALRIPRQEIWDSHMQAKKKLLELIKDKTGTDMHANVLTIGFARRNTPYKRMDLMFRWIDRLIDINDNAGKLQFVLAGKTHPHDGGGKDIIRHVHQVINELKSKIKIVYLENYNINLAKYIVSGVDLWLNTPKRPMEASGTSGMKAVHNAVPNFSVLDGWWIEGHVEDITGWSIGKKEVAENSDDADAEDFYKKLKEKIVPTYYNDRDKWTEIMRHSIAFNASFFNTNRMVHQYVLNSYFH